MVRGVLRYNGQCMWMVFFIFGLIIGSFLNVAILRHNTGLSLAGRSGCMSCAEALSWYELLPVVSFFILRGKCRTCGSAISWQYPIVELSLAVLFALTQLQSFDFVHLALALITSAILLIISIYDAHHTIIPNLYVYAFVALALIWHFPNISLYTFTSAIVLAAPFALLWLFSKGKWIGLGDAKLMLGIGAMLGLFGGFVALTIGSVVGALIGLGYVGFSRKQGKMKLEIPFGPFLVFGFFCVWLLHADIWYLNLINL